MPYEEKSAWTMLVVATAAYAVYAVLVIPRVLACPIADVDYATTLLACVLASILVSIVVNIAFGIAAGRTRMKDERDRRIGSYGEFGGQAFLVVGALAALVLALLEVDWFWIANALYLGFTLSAILGSVLKIAAYRGGMPAW